MGRKELLFVIAAIAVVSLWLARPVSEKAPADPQEATPGFYVETNGRPTQLDDLVVTARFKSPEPVTVGYTDGKLVTNLTVTIDRFEWRFSEDPPPQVEKDEEGNFSAVLCELKVIDEEQLETEKEWIFALSELHCENREMLERLFAGCPVVLKVEAMVALDTSEVRYNRLSKTVTQTVVLEGIPQAGSSERLLQIEEARIRADVARYLDEARGSQSSRELLTK